MRQLFYSPRAELDLDDIAAYTKRQWSVAQADRYVNELEGCCKRLAVSPEIARGCGELRPGLRRMEQGSHVIFFSVDERGIYVARILHKSMLPLRQTF